MEIHIEKLDQNYRAIRDILEGAEPNENIYEQYSLNPDDYKRDFVEVNLTRLNYAIDSYKSSLAHLSKLKSQPRRASNK